MDEGNHPRRHWQQTKTGQEKITIITGRNTSQTDRLHVAAFFREHQGNRKLPPPVLALLLLDCTTVYK